MDEPWSTLTAEEVVEEFTASELAAIKTLKDGADDLQEIVERVMEQIRDAYRSGGRELGETGIPDGLFPRAIAMARWNFILSVPDNPQLQTRVREEAAKEAVAWLTTIAKRELKGSGGAQIASKTTRQATRVRLDGLI